MGEIKSTNEKKKSQLRFNVGGGFALGGVVLLGGGLAVAGLMAAFSIIKNRNSRKDCSKNEDSSAAAAEEKHDESPGLSFVLENPSTVVHQNSCCTSHGTGKIGVTESLVDSKELVSAQNMALGDETLPIMDGEKEILVSDVLDNEMNESCNEIPNNEESSMPVPENVIKNNSCEMRVWDNIEVKKEEEQAETEEVAVEESLSRESFKEEEDDADDSDVSEEHVIEKEEEIAGRELAPKENSPTQSVAQGGGDDDYNDNSENSVDDDEDDSSEDVTEEAEESSAGTGSSSMESNVEAIWPREIIEALSQELKEMNANDQNSGEKMLAKPESRDRLNCKNDGSLFNEYASNNETTENAEMWNEKHNQELVMVKVENTHLPTRKVVVWSLLAILLLLLLMHIHRNTASVHHLSYKNFVVGPRV